MDNIINIINNTGNTNTSNTNTSNTNTIDEIVKYYDDMLQKIEVHKDTHPNLYSIWSIYISKLKERHENISKQFNLILNAIPNTPDLSHRNIIMLYAYNILSDTN